MEQGTKDLLVVAIAALIGFSFVKFYSSTSTRGEIMHPWSVSYDRPKEIRTALGREKSYPMSMKYFWFDEQNDDEGISLVCRGGYNGRDFRR